MAIKIVHCKVEPFDVYIGRPSKWGNPFSIGPDGSREEVIQKYRQYLYHNSTLRSQTGELKDKILGCWCSPRACHGDVLKEFVEQVKDDFHYE